MTPPAAAAPAAGKDWRYDTLTDGRYLVLDDQGRVRIYQRDADGISAVYAASKPRRVARWIPNAGLTLTTTTPAAHTGPLAALLDDPHTARVAYALADRTRPRCARCNRPAPNAAEQGGYGSECLSIIGRVA